MTGSTCFYFEPVTCIKAERKREKKVGFRLVLRFSGRGTTWLRFFAVFARAMLNAGGRDGGDGNCVYAVASPNEK